MDPDLEADAMTAAPTPVPALAPATGLRRRVPHWIVAGTIGVLLASIAAAVAIPNLDGVSLHGHESAAIASLRNIASAQSQLQASCAIDVDGNGRGEYGFFAEMAGAVPLRSGNTNASGARIEIPLLSPRFRNVVDGRVRSGDYVLQMFLRAADGSWLAEAEAGGGRGLPVDAAMAEREWLCYAWPIHGGAACKRAFLVTQRGDVLATDMAAHTLHGDGVTPVAGRTGYVQRNGSWQLAIDEVDAEGNLWRAIE